MAKIKEIKIDKPKEFQHSTGKITLKITAGDAHFMTTLIYKNNELIANGDETIQITVDAKSGDVFQIISTVYKPNGSDHVSITVEISDQNHSDSWIFNNELPDYDAGEYEIKIVLI